ncbi:MAG: GerAB/ArcD/ProY family transporter [Clostridia bacterium]|nr:GerAB/ArcD/ProY family transporter [Clostridia bacterium]
MTKQLTTRQAALILFTSVIAGKLLMLPSLISFKSFNDTWIVFLFSLFIDLPFVLLITYLINKLDVDIFTFLQGKIGRFLTKIIAILVSVYFAFRALDIISQSYVMFDNRMYIDLNKYIFFAIMVVAVCYLGSRQLNSLGRTLEIFIYVIVIALVISGFISFGGANFSNLLPIFNSGYMNVVKNTFFHNFWFGDFLMLLLFVGKIKVEKNTTKTILFSYLIGCGVVIYFVLIFISVFNRTAPLHTSAILEISEFKPRLLSEGRFNWIIDILCPLFSICIIGVYSYLSVNSLQFCLARKVKSDKTISVMIVAGIMVAIALILNFSYSIFYDFAILYMPYYSFAIQYILPFAVFLLSFNWLKNRKKRKQA